jgi:hypothetical protein
MPDVGMAKGSCLWGAVSLSASIMNHNLATCHCAMCRKRGGGALLAVECGSDLSFRSEENIGIYQSSE